MNYQKAYSILEQCDSDTVLPKLLQMRRGLNREDFLQLAGVNWSRCNVIDVFDSEKLWTPRIINAALPDLFTPGTGHIPLMMTSEEEEALAALPEQVTIYRGCGPENKYGLTWTLDKTTAERKRFVMRSYQSMPLLMTARINRDNICALKLNVGAPRIITLQIRSHALGIGKQKLPRVFPEVVEEGVDINSELALA